MLIHRFYSYNYWAMFAHSFGEGSTTQNEQGYYIGMETSPFAYWKFFASFDLFSWLLYTSGKISYPTCFIINESIVKCRQMEVCY